MSVIIQHKRGTASQWTSLNPTLEAGEVGWESDTNKFKIGTGSTVWTSLPYATLTPTELTSGYARLAFPNAFTVGGHTITNNAAGTIPLTITGASGQSADLQAWKSDAAATLASISSTGAIFTNSTLFSTLQTYIYGAADYGAALNVQTRATGSQGLIVRARASQTGNLIEAQNSASSVLFSVGSGGAITSASGLTISGVGTFNNNINAFGTTTLWANQQLSLAVRNGVNAPTNLVQYSRNDTTVNGGVGPTGSIWSGATAPENNNSYNLTTGVNPWVSTSQATFTISTTLAWQPFAVNQKIIITGCNISQYNGSWIVTAVGGTTNAWTCTITAGGTSTPFTNTGLTVTTGSIQMEPGIFVRTPSPGSIGLLLKASGATGGNHTDIMRYYDGVGNLKTYITASGDFVAPAISAIWSITSSAQDVTVNAIRARHSVANYRAMLQTWENTSTVLAGVNAVGQMFTGSTTPLNYQVGGTPTATSGTGSVATITLTSASNLAVGDLIQVTGFTPTGYNTSGYAVVSAVSNSAPFSVSYASTATGAMTVAGQVQTVPQMSITSRSTGTVPLMVKGNGFVHNLQTWFKSDGGTAMVVNPYGSLVGFASANQFNSDNGANYVLRTVGTADQRGNHYQVVSSASTTLAGFNGLGQIFTGSTTPIQGSATIAINTQTPTGTTNITITTASAHGISVGQTVVIAGITPSGYNGTWTAQSGTTGSTLIVNIGSNPGAITVAGTVTLNSQLGVTAASATTVPAAIRAAASQTANITEWQNSSGTVLSRISSGGSFASDQQTYIGGGSTSIMNTRLNVATGSSSVIGLAIRGASGQSADLLQIQNNTPSTLLKVDQNGFLTVGGSTVISNALISSTPYGTTQVGIAVRGTAGQTANLQSWQISDSTETTRVRSGGQIGIGSLITGTTFAVNTDIVGGASSIGMVVRGASGQSANLQEWQTNTPTTIASISPSGAFTATGDISTSGYLKSNNSSGDEGGEIFLNKAVTNTTLNGGVTIDVYQNKLRFFEQGGTARGYYIDISGGGASAGTNLVGGGGSFTGGTLTSDLVLAAGSGTVEPLTFQTNSATPTVTSGAMDYDGTVFYQTSNTNPGRALATQNYYYVSSADYGPDYSTNASVQSMLGAATRGITVAAGTTYEYEFYTTVQHTYVTNAGITGTYALTSTTVSGSPVVSTIHQIDYGSNTTGFTTATTMSTIRTTGSVVFSAAISSGSRYNFLRAKGIIRVTGTGTVEIYPGLSLSGIAGDNVWNIQNGTVFKLTPIGNGTVTQVGTWA